MTWLTALRLPPTLPELTRPARRVADAATALPRLAFAAVRHGVFPTPASAAFVLLSEGPRGLPWKVIGDALVRFAQRSGPLTTKLGQILATRSDVLPEAVCVRLEALYARQPAMSQRQLDAALGAAFPRGLPFETFQRQPIGVGSIAQVHRAELVRGGRVVVKLVRPGTYPLQPEHRRPHTAPSLFTLSGPTGRPLRRSPPVSVLRWRAEPAIAWTRGLAAQRPRVGGPCRPVPLECGHASDKVSVTARGL
jgi:hypothetical protein